MAEAATLSAEKLCAITGLTDRQHRNIAKAGYFPPPIRGQYQAGPTLVGLIKYQRELLGKKNDELQQEELAIKRAKRKIIDREFELLDEQYVLKSAIGPALRNISLHQRVVLQRKLEQELAPTLAGLTTIEILAKVRGVVDELCAIFKDETKSWTHD